MTDERYVLFGLDDPYILINSNIIHHICRFFSFYFIYCKFSISSIFDMHGETHQQMKKGKGVASSQNFDNDVYGDAKLIFSSLFSMITDFRNSDIMVSKPCGGSSEPTCLFRVVKPHLMLMIWHIPQLTVLYRAKSTIPHYGSEIYHTVWHANFSSITQSLPAHFCPKRYTYWCFSDVQMLYECRIQIHWSLTSVATLQVS